MADAEKPPVDPSLTVLLERHRPALVRFLTRRGGAVLRSESAGDLVQGVHLQALENRERFDYQGEEQFLAWLFTLARQHLSDRHAHWHALKRKACRLLRISDGESMAGTAVEPIASITGPLTFAQRREMVDTAIKALASLPPRDREFVQSITEDVSIRELADRLGISYAAAERGRLRALERFRKAFQLLADFTV